MSLTIFFIYILLRWKDKSMIQLLIQLSAQLTGNQTVRVWTFLMYLMIYSAINVHYIQNRFYLLKKKWSFIWKNKTKNVGTKIKWIICLFTHCSSKKKRQNWGSPSKIIGFGCLSGIYRSKFFIETLRPGSKLPW